MRYLSLFSGIEAASVAWAPLGWEAVAFAEIDPFARSVLAARFPDVPNLGDVTNISGETFRDKIDIIVGGSPCQGFSTAGKRAGLADGRSGLALEYVRILSEARPEWLLWENVPGVLSCNGGRDFGTFIGALADVGYSLAWRVLDARFFGVPQRRRRIFVVGHLGADRLRSAKVLFDAEGVRGDTAPRRQEAEDVAGTLEAGSGRSRGAGTPVSMLVRDANPDIYVPEIVSQAMSCKWAKGYSGPAGDEHHNLVAVPEPLGYATSGVGWWREGIGPLRARAQDSHENVCVVPGAPIGVRRLTPKECERLQGFPDDWTLVEHRGKPAADGPRYRALGNSMAVPVMRWLGRRIARVAGGSGR